MGAKKPHRFETIDREFPVRLTILSKPETHELTRIWLQRHVGADNYASTPQTLWTHNRATGRNYLKKLSANVRADFQLTHFKLLSAFQNQ